MPRIATLVAAGVVSGRAVYLVSALFEESVERGRSVMEQIRSKRR